MPDPFERGTRRGLARGLGRGAAQHHRQRDVLLRGVHRQQVRRLEHEAHDLGALVGALVVAHRREVDAVEHDRPGVDVVEAGEAVDQRRLARARTAGDGEELTLANGQVDALDRVHDVGAGAVRLP